MAELTPELAGKVLQAETRNLIKKVGDGGSLTTTERQMFLGVLDEHADASELLKKRVTALLRKWLDGGRLSKEEREEISHVLPDARYIVDGGQAQVEPAAEEQPGPEQRRPLTEREACEAYEVSRATYYRWKAMGDSLPEGKDAPPWDDATALVGWYERMRSRGLFKHRCPKGLLVAAKAPQGAAAAKTNRATTEPPPQEEHASPPGPRQPVGKRGFLAELEALQEQVAMLREDYERELQARNTDRAAVLKAEYLGLLETLRKYEKDKEQIATATNELVRKSEVEKDLAERLPAIVASLEYLIDRVDGVLVNVTDRAERRRIWRQELAACFKSMATSRFAQPFTLEAA
jgi:hypothetical protein